jgi:hypothetical protein
MVDGRRGAAADGGVSVVKVFRVRGTPPVIHGRCRERHEHRHRDSRINARPRSSSFKIDRRHEQFINCRLQCRGVLLTNAARSAALVERPKLPGGLPNPARALGGAPLQGPQHQQQRHDQQDTGCYEKNRRHGVYLFTDSSPAVES